MDLSVVIPARNEEWLSRTIDSVFSAARAETEVIAILDGYWPDPAIPSPRKNLTLIHHHDPVGQRAATNEGARISTAKYVMKFDAHCMFDDGFDIKLMADCQHDWTVVPRMYNLHVFDWVCRGCGARTYQNGMPARCEVPDPDKKEGTIPNPACSSTTFKKEIVWHPRWDKRYNDFMRFDNTLHFQYWSDYRKRPEAQGDIVDQMCCIGACWMMERSRYWEIGGMDEKHGSWGQMGAEISCKSHLSGGRQVVNKKTWFSHLFRTQRSFGFPYHNPQSAVNQAREYSRWLWRGGNWPQAIHPLSWLLEKYWPIPDWTDEDLAQLKKEERK